MDALHGMRGTTSVIPRVAVGMPAACRAADPSMRRRSPARAACAGCGRESRGSRARVAAEGSSTSISMVTGSTTRRRLNGSAASPSRLPGRTSGSAPTSGVICRSPGRMRRGGVSISITRSGGAGATGTSSGGWSDSPRPSRTFAIAWPPISGFADSRGTGCSPAPSGSSTSPPFASDPSTTRRATAPSVSRPSGGITLASAPRGPVSTSWARAASGTWWRSPTGACSPFSVHCGGGAAEVRSSSHGEMETSGATSVRPTSTST